MIKDPLGNIIIILAGVKYPGNVGSVARAMNNMGLSQLRLAAPQCEINSESYRMARSGGKILECAKKYRSLKSALRGIHFVVGTSAKTGGRRAYSQSPRLLTPRVLAQAAAQKVGILFGPEDTGLIDDDLMLCQVLMRIPTHSRGRSMNLAQAVMVVCYELFLGSKSEERVRAPRLASSMQVEAMYEQLESALLDIGFLHPQNARHMMFAVRRLLGRAGLEAEDVGILRGIARQIAWSARSNYNKITAQDPDSRKSDETPDAAQHRSR
jgi:tRNA/rRNA methyltransferase